jgi:large subunit ribosomal protein L4
MATVDIVNTNNERVGSIELNDDVFGGRPNVDVIWTSVVRDNAAEHRGTHATKNRANVSGSGRKPWRQKGTGRARVSEIRNPLWRKGGTVFGPQPRSYDYAIPRKVHLAAIKAALGQKFQEGALGIVDSLGVAEGKTKAAAEMVARWYGDAKRARTAKTLIIDVNPDPGFARVVRNLRGVTLVSSGRVTARDIMDGQRVVVTKAAVERLQTALSRGARDREHAAAVEPNAAE